MDNLESVILPFSWSLASCEIWGLVSGLGRRHNQQLYSNAMLSLSKNSLHILLMYRLLLFQLFLRSEVKSLILTIFFTYQTADDLGRKKN